MAKNNKSQVVWARITEAEYRSLLFIAKTYAPPGEKPKVSIPVREAIRQYLKKFYGTETE